MQVLIIEDEQLASDKLQMLLHEVADNIEVLEVIESVSQAVLWLQQHEADLIFLDIHLSDDLSFKIFEQVDIQTPIIFTTAYDEYAIKAIRYAAFDYLLKPIADQEFVDCIHRLQDYQHSAEQLQYLQRNIQQPQMINQITINHLKGMIFLNVDDIVMMMSDNNYTQIFVKDQKPIISSKTLGHYVRLLDDHKHFFRCHKQYFINTKLVKEYYGGDENVVLLDGGLKASVSRSQRKKFLERFRGR